MASSTSRPGALTIIDTSSIAAPCALQISSALREGNLTPVDSITLRLERWILSVSSGVITFRLRRGLEMDLIVWLTVALLLEAQGAKSGNVLADQPPVSGKSGRAAIPLALAKARITLIRPFLISSSTKAGGLDRRSFSTCSAALAAIGFLPEATQAS